MPSRDTYIDLCGIEYAVTVEFTIDSWGAPATWTDPAEGAEISIDKVYYRDDPTERDISPLLSTLRDHSLQYYMANDGKLKLQYGYGFKLYHGTFTAQCGSDFRLHVKHHKPQLTFNENRTLLDVIETEIHDNLHEYDDGGYDD